MRSHPGAAAAVPAYLVAAVMTGTTLPNALWADYQERLEISTATVSGVFAGYAAAVVVSLVAWGSLADRTGPRRVLRRGLLLSAAASLVSLADGLPALAAGRALAGLSVGVVSGAAVAALSEVSRGGSAGAARTSTVATMVGLAAGPMLAAVVVTASGDLRGAYLAHLALLSPALVWLRLHGAGHFAPASSSGGVRSRGRGRGALALPSNRALFAGAALAGFSANAQLGLYAALAPAMLAAALDTTSVLVSGVAGCLLFAAAGVAQLATGGLSSPARLTSAVAVLGAGVATVAWALAAGSVPLLLIAVVLGGFGSGLAFGEGLAVAARAALPGERAGVSSTWFAVAYLGLVAPVLGAGALADTLGAPTAAALVSAGACALVLAAAVVIHSTETPASPNQHVRTGDRIRTGDRRSRDASAEHDGHRR